MHSTKAQILAFAGLYQAAKLIHDIAATGKCSYDDFKINVQYLLANNSLNHTLSQINALKTGLTCCSNYLSLSVMNAEGTYINRYVATLCAIENQLKKTPHIGECRSKGATTAC